MLRIPNSLSICLVLAGSVLAEERKKERIQFEPGTSQAIVSGKLAGRDDVTYKRNAREGQFLHVRMLPGNKGADFNVFIPGKVPGDEALFSSFRF